MGRACKLDKIRIGHRNLGYEKNTKGARTAYVSDGMGLTEYNPHINHVDRTKKYQNATETMLMVYTGSSRQLSFFTCLGENPNLLN